MSPLQEATADTAETVAMEVPAASQHTAASPFSCPPDASPPRCAPSPSERKQADFSVLTLNSLADAYTRSSTFPGVPRKYLHWQYRSQLLRHVLDTAAADLLCLQEVDHIESLLPVFDEHDMDVFFSRRPARKHDGGLIAWKRSLFQLAPIAELKEQVLAQEPLQQQQQSFYAAETELEDDDVEDGSAEHRHDMATSCASSLSSTSSISAGISSSNVAVARFHAESDSPNSKSKMSRSRACRQSQSLLPKKQKHQQQTPVNPSAIAGSSSDDTFLKLSSDHLARLVQPCASAYTVDFDDIARFPTVSPGAHSRLLKHNHGLICCLSFVHDPQRVVIVGNTHLYWSPLFEDVKIKQAHYFMWHIRAAQQRVQEEMSLKTLPAVVICGDFNSTPDSAVYKYLTLGKFQGSILEPKFLIDSSIRRVGRWLRMLGYDAESFPSQGYDKQQLLLQQSKSNSKSESKGKESTSSSTSNAKKKSKKLTVAQRYGPVFEQARQEHRIVVTQNRKLVQQRLCPPHYLIPNRTDPREALRLLSHHYHLTLDPETFYQRCPSCWGSFETLALSEARTLPFVDEVFHNGFDKFGHAITFCRCNNCGRVRWFSERARLDRMAEFVPYVYSSFTDEVHKPSMQPVQPGLPYADVFLDRWGVTDNDLQAAIAASLQDTTAEKRLRGLQYQQRAFLEEAFTGTSDHKTQSDDSLVWESFVAQQLMVASDPHTKLNVDSNDVPVCLAPHEIRRQLASPAHHQRYSLPSGMNLNSAYQDHRMKVDIQINCVGTGSDSDNAAAGADADLVTLSIKPAEPHFTNYTTSFVDTLDYVFFGVAPSESVSNEAHQRSNSNKCASQTLECVYTAPLAGSDPQLTREHAGFPCKDWPSDHISLMCGLKFT
jgi:mRNA deadenylase 3'-5' endonuclease subunit Ccr4/uncharacterized protein with PIN domain